MKPFRDSLGSIARQLGFSWNATLFDDISVTVPESPGGRSPTGGMAQFARARETAAGRGRRNKRTEFCPALRWPDPGRPNSTSAAGQLSCIAIANQDWHFRHIVNDQKFGVGVSDDVDNA